MLKLEFNRIFVKNRFYIIIIVFLIAKIITLSFSHPCFNTKVELIHDDYIEYLSKFEGELSKESDEAISSDYSSLLKSIDEYNNLQNDYNNGLLDYSEYSTKLNILKNVLEQSDVIEEAYSSLEYVKEEPKNRWLIYSNGWEAFMANERCDYVLIFILLLFTLYLFALDYDVKSHKIIFSTIYGQTKLFNVKQLLLHFFIFSANFLSLIEELFFYKIKYGLSHYNAPIQSLISFRNSPYNITILEALLIIFAFKIIGCIILSYLTVFINAFIKKMWSTGLIMFLLILIPHAILNGKTFRFFIQPLGLFLGNGYLKGCSDFVLKDNILISEPSERISPFYTITTLIIVPTLIYILSIASKKKMFIKFKFRPKSILNLIFVLGISVVLLVAFAFANKENSIAFSNCYSKATGYSDENYCYINDGIFTAIELSSNNHENIIKDVTRNKAVDNFYIDDEYIYYAQKDDVSGIVTYYSIDKMSYTEKEIYSEIKGIRQYNMDFKYLGFINAINIENVSMEYYEKQELSSFWVDGNLLFTVDNNGINIIDYQKNTLLTSIDVQIYSNCVAYYKGIIYYIDITNNLYSFNVNKRITSKMNVDRCKKLFITEGIPIVVNFDDKIGIVNEITEWIENVTVLPTSNISINNNNIVFVNKNYNPTVVDTKKLNVYEYTTGYKAYDIISTNENTKAYIYINNNEDFEWQMIDNMHLSS